MHRRWHRFNEEERRKWQDPEQILREVGLKRGQTFLDIGCGDGFFTLPAAHIVGPEGQVFGLDIDSEALNEIQVKATSLGLNNIQLKTGKAEEIVLCEGCADIIFMGIVLHDFQDPLKALGNARRMIKPDGVLVNLDWKKTPMEFGPPVARRFDEATAAGLIEGAGFVIVAINNSGDYHYLITARPRPVAGKVGQPGL
ncbi:MAG: class I SAM-dependent methyltransferase [Dehalococcoidales bacterium]|jgi:ubiquinone/menaquinone biosynthesis C-methylase UbiE|nr:class I SAM-dependent methyltransferase [Dehalococcoidales bacterium]